MKTDTADLFGRHLDLAPLRRRPRGVVKCVFHQDRAASLSVDLDRGLFHCFGCGVKGGIRRFVELVGEAPVVHASESPLQAARRAAARRAFREGQRTAAWEDWNARADFVRECVQIVSDTRRLVNQTMGPEHPRAWLLLDLAAGVERAAFAIDAVLLETVA